MEQRSGSTGTIIRFGAFELDTNAWQLRKRGVRLKISGQPLEILTALVEHPGRLVTREELRTKLWPSTVVDFEHSLNAAINKLREALGDSPEHPRYIETVPRRGYRFIWPINGEVHAAGEQPRLADSALAPAIPTAVSAPAAPPVDAPPREPATAIPATAPVLSAGSRSSPFLFVGLATALLLAAVAALYWRARRPTPARYVQLTNFADSASSPALSPDGRMLAFIRGEGTFVVPGQLYVKLLPDGEPVPLAGDALPKMSPAFSPDGSRIAYTVNDRWAWDTWVVPVLGGAPRKWLPNASGLGWIDERNVLFSEIDSGIHMNLITANENRGDARPVYRPPTEGGMAHRSYLSPDRRWVLLAEMDVTGWLPCRVVPFDGSSAGRSVGPSPARCTNAAWSPDGRWMYFSADAGDGFHLWRQRFLQGTPEQLTSGPTEEEGIAIARDGKSLITSIGSEHSAVWLHDGAGERQISSEGYAFVPTLSSDGGKLYYLLRSGSFRAFVGGELWVSNVLSGQRERLLPGVLITRYDISQDGKRLVFASEDGNGKSSLWITSLDNSSAPRQLVSADAYRPLFAPDGSIFFLHREVDSKYVSRIKDDGTGLERMIRDPVISMQSLSPDGRWVVVWVASDARERSGAVIAYSTAGEASKLICVVCAVSATFPIVRWSRDQRFFYFASHLVPAMRVGKTFVVPLAQGEAFPQLPGGGFNSDGELQALPGVQVLPQTDISPGADPAVYAFSRSATERNLYRIDVP